MEETLGYMTDDLPNYLDCSELQAALDKWDEFQEKLKTKIKQAIEYQKAAESADEDDDSEGAD